MGKLDTYHGAPSGVVQADEHLAGFEPSHGTELCGVVEAMFSYEISADIIGDPIFFERAEQIAYNALPATMVCAKRCQAPSLHILIALSGSTADQGYVGPPISPTGKRNECCHRGSSHVRALRIHQQLVIDKADL
jgi:hypothetical protein